MALLRTLHFPFHNPLEDGNKSNLRNVAELIICDSVGYNIKLNNHIYFNFSFPTPAPQTVTILQKRPGYI